MSESQSRVNEMDNTCSQHKSNSGPEFDVLQREFDTVEVPVNMGAMRFTIDVLSAELVRDIRCDNAETLNVEVELRGPNSKGEELVMHRTVSLIAS